MNELPLGFGMALLQNPKATQYFGGCTESQQASILSQAQQMQTKQDMQAFVDSLTKTAL